MVKWLRLLPSLLIRWYVNMSRRGRPPGSKAVPEPIVEPTNALTVEYATLPVIENPTIEETEINMEPETQLIPTFNNDSVAYSVIRSGDVYQLIRFSFNRETLTSSKGEVVLENADRWEVQSLFDFHADESFLMKDDL